MVCGRARVVVVVGSNTAMGNICDSMLRTEDISNYTYCELYRILIDLIFLSTYILMLEATPLKRKLDEVCTFLA